MAWLPGLGCFRVPAQRLGFAASLSCRSGLGTRSSHPTFPGVWAALAVSRLHSRARRIEKGLLPWKSSPPPTFSPAELFSGTAGERGGGKEFRKGGLSWGTAPAPPEQTLWGTETVLFLECFSKLPEIIFSAFFGF